MGTYCGRAWRLPVREESFKTVEGILDVAINPPKELYDAEGRAGEMTRELNTQFNWGGVDFFQWRRKEWVKEGDLYVFYCYSSTKITSSQVRERFLTQLLPYLEAPEGTILFREFGEDWQRESIQVVADGKIKEVPGIPWFGYGGNKTVRDSDPRELYPLEFWQIAAVKEEADRRQKEFDDNQPFGGYGI